MNHEYNVEKIIKNFNVDLDTNPRTDESILNELIETQQKSKKTYSGIMNYENIFYICILFFICIELIGR